MQRSASASNLHWKGVFTASPEYTGPASSISSLPLVLNCMISAGVVVAKQGAAETGKEGSVKVVGELGSRCGSVAALRILGMRLAKTGAPELTPSWLTGSLPRRRTKTILKGQYRV